VEADEAGEALKVIMEFLTLHDTEDPTLRQHPTASARRADRLK
jgi:hypothetical protein